MLISRWPEVTGAANGCLGRGSAAVQPPAVLPYDRAIQTSNDPVSRHPLPPATSFWQPTNPGLLNGRGLRYSGGLAAPGKAACPAEGTGRASLGRETEIEEPVGQRATSEDGTEQAWLLSVF